MATRIFANRGLLVIHSKETVTTAIIKIPSIKAENCLKDSFGSSSLRRSGRTVTNAMCKKVPAVKGSIHDVLASAIMRNQLNQVYMKLKCSILDSKAFLRSFKELLICIMSISKAIYKI